MASSEDDNNNDGGEMGPGSMFNNKSSSSLFGSGWDPLENFGTEFGGGSGYPVGVENHYESFVNPFVNLNPDQCVGICSSPNSSRDKSFNPVVTNGERNDNASENMNQQQKTVRGKQAKDHSESYIHVRAKRGQATNSHSLAERVRRERISERMKLLQELVPGCNKITGKAVMLDEIINYVQSLQQQVEFLSMKLATVNPELNIDIDRLVFKDVLHSRGNNSNTCLLRYAPGLSSSQPYPPGIQTTTAPLRSQPIWDNDLHNLLQMGFDVHNNLGPNGRAKMDL